MSSENEGKGWSDNLDNFTPRAQMVLALARKEADRFNHSFVGTEHLLLGIIKLGQGTAVNVLRKLGIDLERARTEVEKQVGPGPSQEVFSSIPYTPRTKKVLVLASQEAKALNHTYVGTEHLLLGLLRERDGIAARVLMNLGADIDTTRQEIIKELEPNFQDTVASQPKAERIRIVLPPKPQPDSVDTTKRYDVYCVEGHKGVAVYRNALFKSVKFLVAGIPYDPRFRFVELEQADGQTIFVALHRILKFHEHHPTQSAGTSG
jgi:ATP-dependent Clp protease ATP-binding subunit ClpA